MRVIDVHVPYFTYVHKCTLNVYVDREAFDKILRDFSGTNIFSFIDRGEDKYPVVGLDFSDLIPEEIWNIGGQQKSPLDKWKIATAINDHCDEAMRKFIELTGVT